ncbi:putative tyrosinase-like protein tyr-3 [Orchesella cincta]|uniref:Putative tyrosinase-like protein tyr-3 n=1 Tax=Orchesella cincta TaxID=48709 RepID=A0A1D2MA67_ORCCI|nr:putative tyrosinase-like protein tyr-3 [Orchesella cincta]
MDPVTECRLCLKKEFCAWNSDVETCISNDVNIGALVTKTENCMKDLTVPDHKVCKDSHRLCSQWAAKGQCKKFPEYMLKNCEVSCSVCIPEADCSKIIPGSSTWTTAYYCSTCTRQLNCVFSVLNNSCVSKDTLENPDLDNPNYIQSPNSCDRDTYEFGCVGHDIDCQACIMRPHCVWHWQVKNCVNPEFLLQEDIWHINDPLLCGFDKVSSACNKKYDDSKSLLDNCLSCTDGNPLCTLAKHGGKYSCVRKDITVNEIFHQGIENRDRAGCYNITTEG